MKKVIVNEDARKKVNERTLSTMDLLPGKIYDVIAEEPFINGIWYRIVDEDEEDYLYPPSLFDIVEEE